MTIATSSHERIATSSGRAHRASADNPGESVELIFSCLMAIVADRAVLAARHCSSAVYILLLIRGDMRWRSARITRRFLSLKIKSREFWARGLPLRIDKTSNERTRLDRLSKILNKLADSVSIVQRDSSKGSEQQEDYGRPHQF